MKHSSPPIRIGTSGIILPGPKSGFPPEFKKKSRLAYYSTLFNAIEINSTFYKLPMIRTLERWAAEVPPDFRFTVKMHQEITHGKGLVFSLPLLKEFMRAVEVLQEKRGCLLLQFPASLKASHFKKLTDLLGRIDHLNADKGWKVAVEFRDVSWYTAEILKVLKKRNAMLVYHDIPKSHTPLDLANFDDMYFRFHGIKGDYRGSYDPAFLHQFADNLLDWRRKGKSLSIFFNNTMGSAFSDATLLQKYCNEGHQ